MKLKKSFVSLLLVVTLLCAMIVPVSAAAEPKLTVTPSVTKIDMGTGTADVIYTVSLDPNGNKIAAFQFTLTAPAGMILATTKVKEKSGDGYWINAASLQRIDVDGFEDNPFSTFAYAPTTGYFGASGGLEGKTLKTTAVIMTIKATVDISAVKTYTLGVTGFICYGVGAVEQGGSNPVVTNVNVTAVTKPATSIKLNKDKTTIYTGNTETLTATVEPTDTTDTVTWSSSDLSVATVDNGQVRAIKKGTATITAKAGSKSATCVVTVENAPCAHTKKTDVAEKASSCTEKGWDAYKRCDNCGQLFDVSGNKISEIPYRALANHTGGTATCTKKAVCDVCGNEYGENDSTNHASTDIYYVTTSTTHQKMHKCCETPAEATPVNHTWSNGVCSVCKYECKHDYSYTKIDGEDKHTKACKLCDVSEAVPCSGGTATCTAKPICKDCNTAYGNTVPHKTGKVEAKAATCLVAGNKQYWVCSTCLSYFEDKAATQLIANKSDVIIAAKGHHYGDGYVSDATGHWHICEDCGAKDTVEQHTFKNGTPTETEAKKCLTCGYVAANPTGEHKTHTPSLSWNGVDDNYHWHTCDNCNEKIDKTAHDFDTAVIDKPATKTEAGQQHKVCKTCGYIKCEVIPATGTTGGTTGGNGNNANAKNPYTKDNGKTVESGKTFDAGIALYVGLSLLSVTGGALVIGKKKEF